MPTIELVGLAQMQQSLFIDHKAMSDRRLTQNPR